MQLRATHELEVHAPGVFPGVCVDVIDLGIQPKQVPGGQTRLVPMVRLVFETVAGDQRQTLSRTFTCSLHPKANLTKFLSAWRGRPIQPGEQIDLGKLFGLPCTVVVAQFPKEDGSGVYARIESVSRGMTPVTPNGTYDPVAERDRMRIWYARNGGNPANVVGHTHAAPTSNPRTN
jgi:hypothetical protein